MHEELLLNLAHLETAIQSTAVYFQVHTRKSTIHHLSRCLRRVAEQRDLIFGTFLSTNRHESLFERLTKLYGIQSEQIFFLTVKCSCNIKCMLVPPMAKVASISRWVTDNIAISVEAQHQWFPEQQLILDDLDRIRLGMNYDLG